MAAGLGFKTFTTGEVLTAANVNGYLMQGINVFASTAARDAAITSPQEGQFAFTKDTNGLWYYDGAAWVASGATGDIEGVTAGIGISGGGTSGTVTVTNSMATAIDAKGDLVAGTAADALSRLAVGTNGQILTADSTAATGLAWATASASSGPAFSAKSAAEQTISANTNTKVTFGTEDFDTAGNFASSRFTPTTAGYYQINASLTLSSNSAGEFYGFFYKNGANINRFSNTASALTNNTVSGGMVVSMNGSSDYLECYVAITNTGNPRIDSGSGQTQFSGVWIRGL